MNLDESQGQFVRSDASHIRLLAPAGSGKTASLLQRCLELANRGDGGRFLILTFTRVARDELVLRMSQDGSLSQIKDRVRVDTLNQWGYNYLKRNVESQLQLKTSREELFGLVAHVLRPIWMQDPRASKALEKKSRYFTFLELLSSVKTLGFTFDGEEPVDSFVNHWSWLNGVGLQRYFEVEVQQNAETLGLLASKARSTAAQWVPFVRLMRQCVEHLWNSAFLMFEDQKYWALLKLRERYPDAAGFIEANRYHHILVDEFQDVNPLDILLIKELARVNRASLTIVGDDDQAIFEWRGAAPAFILEPNLFFVQEFSSYTLSNNYRCPRNITTISQNLIHHNKLRIAKDVVAKVEFDAEVKVLRFENHAASLAHVLNLALAASNSGEPNALSVISRKKCQLIPLQIILTSRDVQYFAREDLNILLSPAFEDLRDVLVTIPRQRERRYCKDIVNEFLICCNKALMFALRKDESRRLYAALMSQQPSTFQECIRYFQSYDGAFGGRVHNQELVLKVAFSIAKILEAKTVAEAIECMSELPGLQKHYAKSDDDIFYKDPPFAHLSEYARSYGNDFIGFVEHVERAIARLPNSPDVNEDGVDKSQRAPVHLMTALRAKGKEFKHVVILDVVEGIWPIRQADTEERLEQERRLFYVATTRASKALDFCVVDTLLGGQVEPSRYLSELGIG